MSQLFLLRRISKLSLTKKPISACFSTATRSKSKPYLLLKTEIDYNNVLNFHLYDLTKNKEVVKIQDQSKTLKKLFEKSRQIGSSRSHLVLRNKKGSRVHLVDISNQLKPKIITLPRLHFDKNEIYLNYNVSVSSPVNGEIIVAANFDGSRLSLCRVGDSEWTRIDVPCPSFEDSSLIYSERDKRFYLNNRDRNYTGLIDLAPPKSGLVTPVSGYPFPISNLAEFEKDVMTLPHFRFKEQLVESPSGQSFIVCRVTCHFNNKGEMVAPLYYAEPWAKEKTQKIVVYKQDEEEEICSYSVTKDIGDLCIFIGENEPFCVSASDYSFLKPNSVYFTGYGSDFGVCDLFSQTILNFSENVTPDHYSSMCWIPPYSYSLTS